MATAMWTPRQRAIRSRAYTRPTAAIRRRLPCRQLMAARPRPGRSSSLQESDVSDSQHVARRSLHTGGYAMAALLVAMTIMAIFMSMALPAWRTVAQREKEDELVFRGQQYARAIALFQRKYANTFPPSVNILIDGHFLRRKYKDPMTGGDFQVVYANQQAQAGTGGIAPTQG